MFKVIFVEFIPFSWSYYRETGLLWSARSWFLQKLLLSEQDNCAWLLKDTDREKEPLNFNSSAYKKYEHGDLGSWYIKATLCKKFPYWKKIFKKNEVATGKTLFFLTCPFWTTHSIYLNISFQQGSFVWKWCAVILSTFNQNIALQFFEKGFRFSENLFQS